MLPIRDENPHFLTPATTRGLIAANALVWVLVQGLGFGPSLVSSICEFGLIPADLLGGERPLAAPAESFCPVQGGARWHTLLSSMFMHGSWLHILGNMWFLSIFGNNIEDSMGHGRFLVFYLLSGLAAGVLQMVVAPDSAAPMVGASGAIGGVMGAYLVLFPLVRVHVMVMPFFFTSISVPAVVVLGYWFVVDNLSRALVVPAGAGGVAFWAHIGGFLFGALSVPLFRVRERVERHPYHGWRGPRAGGLRRYPR